MTSSAPSLSFAPATTAFGTIDVGTSSAYFSYHIRNKAGSYATARNMSVSFLGSINSSEVKDESWVQVSTSLQEEPVTSQDGGNECPVAPVSNTYNQSRAIAAKLVVPAGAATSGTVNFLLHHRYQFTG